jgi:hypothetical protein
MNLPYNGFSPRERNKVIPIQSRAFETGKVARPTHCSICWTPETRTTGRRSIIAHLEDYREPLKLHPCCGSCHNALHIRFTKPERWLSKLAAHGRPGSWFTLITMDRESQTRPYDETYPGGLPDPDWPSQ